MRMRNFHPTFVSWSLLAVAEMQFLVDVQMVFRLHAEAEVAFG